MCVSAGGRCNIYYMPRNLIYVCTAIPSVICGVYGVKTRVYILIHNKSRNKLSIYSYNCNCVSTWRNRIGRETAVFGCFQNAPDSLHKTPRQLPILLHFIDTGKRLPCSLSPLAPIAPFLPFSYLPIIPTSVRATFNSFSVFRFFSSQCNFSIRYVCWSSM